MLNQCQSIIDFRIDSNTYLKKYLATEKVLSSIKNTTIEKLSISVQNFGAYSLCNYINYIDDENNGIPFLMTENVRNNFIDWNIRKFVDGESHELLYKSHCKKNQVLITMAGEYLGRVAVYDKSFECSSNQAIAKVTLQDESRAFIYSTFLNSIYGQNQINRFKTSTGQPNINMSLIKSLIIPYFSDEFSEAIKLLMMQSNKEKLRSVEKYDEAEKILLEALGLSNFKVHNEAVNVKSFKESFGATGRLDAEYYQIKYEQIVHTLKSVKNKALKQIVTVHKSIEPGTEAYQEEGIPFIRVSNLSKFGISDTNIFLDPNVFENTIKPKTDTILLTKDGTVGVAYKANCDLDYITSGALLHLTITDNEVLPDYLTLVLNSVVVQMQAERDAGGSIIKHWKPSEIEQVVIPVIDIEIQKQISKLVQENFNLRSVSENLLEVAKQAVEISVEENEAAAVEHINKNS